MSEEKFEDEGGRVRDEPYEGEGVGDPRTQSGEDESPPAPEGEVQDDEYFGPSVVVGPHELSGIKVTTRGYDGTVVEARLNLQEAAMLVAHTNALITMMFNSFYAQQAQAAMQAAEELNKSARRLYVPRR